MVDVRSSSRANFYEEGTPGSSPPTSALKRAKSSMSNALQGMMPGRTSSASSGVFLRCAGVNGDLTCEPTIDDAGAVEGRENIDEPSLIDGSSNMLDFRLLVSHVSAGDGFLASSETSLSGFVQFAQPELPS